jgi:hypothetical protein
VISEGCRDSGLSIDAAPRGDNAYRDVEAGEAAAAIGAAYPTAAAGQRKRQSARAAREWVRPDEQTHRLASLDRPLHAHPGGEREPIQRRGWRVGQIEGGDAKPAGLQDKTERLYCAIDDVINQGPRAQASGLRAV